MTHLNRTQMRILRELLEQRAATASAQIRLKAGQRAEETYAALAGSVADEGDESTADLIVDVDNAMIGMELAELRDVEAARERMKRRQYGICTDCKQEIDFARLQAYPTAKRCARCQDLHERTFATAPHSTL